MSVTVCPSCRQKLEEPCEHMFTLQEERKCPSPFCNGNLHCIGKVWIQSLRSFLLGVKYCPRIPTIHAGWGHESKDPERPPPMKPSDLSCYASPHEAYKNFLEDKMCCESHLLHDMVLPYVKTTRESCQNIAKIIKSELCGVANEIKSDFAADKKSMTAFWRDDKHLVARKGLMVTGGLLGYYLGSKGGIPRRVFYVACAEAATGMLCFPKETDATIRHVSYTAATALLKFFNFMSGTNIEMRPQIPCPKPKPPDEKYKILCTEKK